MPPVTLTAEFKIVTPMFIGGADQSPSDGIRPPSVKGALRFWWRALNWGRFYNDYSENETDALKALHKREAELFGQVAKSEDHQQAGGQGAFLLEVIRQPNLESFVTDWPKSHTAPGVNSKSGYLGLGLFGMNGHEQRHAIKEDDSFTLKLRFRPNAKDCDIKEIRTALTAFGLFGGLGSRLRRGFGSIALTELDGKNTTQSLDDYKSALSDILKQIVHPPVLPPFTAFSSHTKVAYEVIGGDARKVHSEAGNRYLNHRSLLRGYGKRWFGLPLTGVSNPNERRGSPLLFHIHPIGNKFVCLNLFLPARFLPNEKTEPNNFADIASFLNGLTAFP